MLDDQQRCPPPFEIIVTDDTFLKPIPRCASSDSLTITTAGQESLDASLPHYVEVSPGNYYEVLASRWESELGLSEQRTDQDPTDCITPQWPHESPHHHNNKNEQFTARAGPKRPSRRGSLVMTLKKTATAMIQEDSVSGTKPQLAATATRGGCSLDKPVEGSVTAALICEADKTAKDAPHRPFRRASIKMGNSQDDKPLRRGSLVMTFAELEYEVPASSDHDAAAPRISHSSLPPRLPSRKSSMDLCSYDVTTEDKVGEPRQEQRRGNLLWTVTPCHTDDSGNEDQIYLMLTGFSFDDNQGAAATYKNEIPKCPNRIGSMDTSCSGRGCSAA